MDRAIITASGDVQGVGFRYETRAIARTCNVVGKVENMDDGTVRIVAEGNRQDIEALIEELRRSEPPIEVERMDVEYKEATKEFKEFTIVQKDGMNDVVEAIITGHSYLRNISKKIDQVRGQNDKIIGQNDKIIGQNDKIIGQNDKMLKKTDHIIEQNDEMLKKTDHIIENTDHIRGQNDQLLEKTDHIIVQNDETISEIRGLPRSTRDMIDNRIGRMEIDIRQIKEKIDP